MTDLWPWIGWIGNACFFSRFLVQWWRSEKAGRSVAPVAFWWLSLAGTLLLFAYTLHRGELVLLAGFTVNALLYGRNLQLARASEARPRLRRSVLFGIALVALTALIVAGVLRLRLATLTTPVWLVIGVVGQSVWCSRFVLQWIATERTGESHFPHAFWWVSLAGNSLLLAYAIHLGDPVWIAGLALGPLVQIRNLMLMRKNPPCGGRNSSNGTSDAEACRPRPIKERERRARDAARESLGPARPSH